MYIPSAISRIYTALPEIIIIVQSCAVSSILAKSRELVVITLSLQLIAN